jgi:DNA-binding NarL/FixJ family response regulator
MKITRVLYVEDDPTLSAIVSNLLNSREELDVVNVSSSREALDKVSNQVFNVALLDISLGAENLSGIELAHQIRKIHLQMGIVFFSQYAASANPKTKDDYFMGWSTIAKSGKLDAEQISKVLIDASKGISHREERDDLHLKSSIDKSFNLSPRQVQIMGLLSQGADATKVAEALHLAPITVRAELSKIYKIIVPEPEPGTDLRTTAVLRYLRSTTSSIWLGNE